jgi:hypothetical protein
MIKLFTKLFILSTFILSIASCTVTNKGFQASPVISRNVELDPIKADLKVDENAKITGESSATYVLALRIQSDNTFAEGINYSTDYSSRLVEKLNPFRTINSRRIKRVRDAAAYKALAGNYDVLVHPNYAVTFQNFIFFKKYTVKVDGYGAKYHNFRTEKQKITILEDGKEIILQDR